MHTPHLQRPEQHAGQHYAPPLPAISLTQHTPPSHHLHLASPARSANCNPCFPLTPHPPPPIATTHHTRSMRSKANTWQTYSQASATQHPTTDSITHHHTLAFTCVAHASGRHAYQPRHPHSQCTAPTHHTPSFMNMVVVVSVEIMCERGTMHNSCRYCYAACLRMQPAQASSTPTYLLADAPPPSISAF